jgi:hypothetical protein
MRSTTVGKKTVPSPTEANTHYCGETRVLDISKRYETVNMVKNDEGKFDPVKRDLGWFVKLEPNITLRLGDDEPNLKKGDKLYVLLISPNEE